MTNAPFSLPMQGGRDIGPRFQAALNDAARPIEPGTILLPTFNQIVGALGYRVIHPIVSAAHDAGHREGAEGLLSAALGYDVRRVEGFMGHPDPEPDEDALAQAADGSARAYLDAVTPTDTAGVRALAEEVRQVHGDDVALALAAIIMDQLGGGNQ